MVFFSFKDKSGATWVELNVQLLQVTVRGRYVAAQVAKEVNTLPLLLHEN